MKSCSLHHWILFFIILIPVADLTVTSLTAKLNQPATLTCNQKCSVMMTWKTFNDYVVARCDQTTCFSDEGFEISHDQYLHGNLDLIMRSADFSKRTLYTCYCGDKAICGVLLNIEALVSQVQKKPGEDLMFNSPIPEVEVVYEGKDKTLPDSEWICSVTAGSLRCGTDYEQRASLSHTELTLRDLKVSDSGVYIIRDTKYKEIIHKYEVSVEEEPPPYWIIGVVLGVVVGILILLLVVILIKHFKGKMNLEKQFRTKVPEMDSLIKRYSEKANRTDPGEVKKTLSKEIAEMDELMNKFIRAKPDLELLNDWWKGKKDQMNKIINECEAEIEPRKENDRAKMEQSSSRSDNNTAADCRERAAEEDGLLTSAL